MRMVRAANFVNNDCNAQSLLIFLLLLRRDPLGRYVAGEFNCFFVEPLRWFEILVKAREFAVCLIVAPARVAHAGEFAANRVIFWIVLQIRFVDFDDLVGDRIVFEMPMTDAEQVMVGRREQ